MRRLICILPILLQVLIAGAQTSRLTFTGADGKTYVRLSASNPSVTPSDSGYDADLLIPHWDPATDLWGYVRRGTLELVVPHRFRHAGRFHSGFAITLHPSATGGEDVYRVEESGQVQCLFRDEEGLGDEMDKHRRANYLYLETEDRMVVFAASGKLLMDKIIHDHESRMTFPAPGLYTLVTDSEMTFHSFEEGLLARWSMSVYDISENAPQKMEESSPMPYYTIHDKNTDRFGILNHRGQLVVRMEWEGLPGRLSMSFTPEYPRFYAPCRDSLFLGIRDGRYYLMHLDGRTVYAYGDHLTPSNEGHFALRTRGWLAVWQFDETKGWFRAYSDLEQHLYHACQDCEQHLLDANHLFRSDRKGNWIMDLKSGEMLPHDLPQSVDMLPAEFIQEGSAITWLLKDPSGRYMGAVTPEGKTVVDFQSMRAATQGPLRQRYHVIQAVFQRPDQSYKAYFAPDGRLLFGGEFMIADYRDPCKGCMMPASMISDNRRQTHPDQTFDDCDIHPYFPDGEYIPNMLLYVEEVKSPKQILKGYMDSYGVKYY